MFSRLVFLKSQTFVLKARAFYLETSVNGHNCILRKNYVACHLTMLDSSAVFPQFLEIANHESNLGSRLSTRMFFHLHSKKCLQELQLLK